MASILILYGTTSGNTQLVSERVGALLQEKGHTVTLRRVEQAKVDDLPAYDVCILGASTYGHGIIQDYFIPFLEQLKSFDLHGQPCAVIGLGDPKYDAQYHIESAKILEAAVQASKGALIAPALLVSGSPIRHLEGVVKKWAETLADKLK